MSSNYKNEDWLGHYHSALLELRQAEITRRIGAARTSIALRLETLKMLPGSHVEERRTLDDALRCLQILDDDRHHQTDEHRIAEQVLENLRHLEPN
jgi:hypothetical protein